VQHGWNAAEGAAVAECNDFDVFLGLILAHLYVQRPKRLDLEVSDFLEEDEGGGFNQERVDNWVNTMDWLISENYIRNFSAHEVEFGDHYSAVELTEKGFRALNSLPASLSGQKSDKSIGSQLVDLSKRTSFKIAEKGADETSRQVTHAIGEFVKSWLM
jgi:predicted transcriptional regulator